MVGYLKGFGLAVLVGGGVFMLGGWDRMDRNFDRIIRHESGNRPDAVGDGGRSLGYGQISYPFYVDAKKEMAEHGITPPSYREAVKSVYWTKQLMYYYGLRYCPKAIASGNLDVYARIHNGGPAGCSKRATARYLAKVKRVK
jgi:hypothetical protein